MRGTALLAALLLTVGASRLARAEPQTEGSTASAAAAFAEGERAYAAGDFTRAAASFERANQLAPRPDNLWNAARAWEKAGQLAAAANDYAAYLRAAPATASDRDTATRALGDLEKHLGRVDVVAPGARELTIDGKRVDAGATYVVPGGHVVAAKFDGGPASRVIEVGAGASTSVALVAPVATDASPVAAPVVRASASPSPSPSPVPPSSESKGARFAPPLVVWIGAGLTVVAGGFLVASGVDTSSARSSFDAAKQAGDVASSTELLTSGQGKEARTNALVGVTAGLGALTAIAAIWFVDWRGAAARASVGLTSGGAATARVAW
ncbi:MAG TPA: hypothetical protein VGM56_03215 [Byssovorax sp.]